jgi:beta-phosphoglucomutase-like phosphatase (HAD superfamily)
VIEDFLAGTRSAKAAGTCVLAVATSYPLDKLREACCVLPSLRDIDPDTVTGKMVQIGQQKRFTGRPAGVARPPSKDE